MTLVPGGDGLQHERTALAWQRTAITAVVVLLPLLLVDARLGAWPLVVLGSLSALVAVALVGRTVPRIRHLHGHHGRHERHGRHDRRLTAMTAMTAMTSPPASPPRPGRRCGRWPWWPPSRPPGRRDGAHRGAVLTARRPVPVTPCRWRRLRLTHAAHDRPPAHGGTLRGGLRLRAQRRPADGDRRPGEADQGGGAGRRAARRHRHRQVGDDRLADRAGAAADAGDGAQQDAGRPAGQRVPRAAAQQRRRVLRQLLRLLPARGVHPADRHLHREGLLDQRRGRAAAAQRHQLAADPARRHRRRLGVLHLRPRHPAGVRRPDGPAPGRPRDRARRAAAPVRPDAVHPQRPRLHPRHVPGPRRHGRDHPGLRGARDPDRVLRRRDRADLHAAPADRRGRPRGERDVRLPGDALRRRSGADGAGDPRHRARARGPARRVREAGQAARGPAAADAHDLRHRDDAPGRVLLRHRELQPAHRRPGPRLGAQLPARLLPRGLPAGHRRVARHRAADRRDVRGRHVPQAQARRPRLPAARARWTTARCGGRSSSSASARPSTSRRRRASTSWPRPTASSSRSSGPTGLVDPEVVLKPTKGQIDDLLHEIRERAPRTSGCSSRR